MVLDTFNKMDADILCYLVLWQTWKKAHKAKRLMKREEIDLRF